jgi:hypothetical protein
MAGGLRILFRSERALRNNVAAEDGMEGSSPSYRRVGLAAVAAGIGLAVVHVTSFPFDLLAAVIAIAIAAFALDANRSIRLPSLRSPMGITLLLLVAVVGGARQYAYSSDTGGLDRAPVRGARDQIQYVSMAFGLAEHGYLGVTVGPQLAEPMVQWAARRDPNASLVSRWEELSRREDMARPHAYRPIGYPLLLGAWFKIVGYRATSFALLNLLLYAIAAAAIFIAASTMRTLWVGVGAVGIFLSSDVVLEWSLQAMPETLTVAAAAVVLALLVRPGSTSRLRGLNAILIGLTLGVLALSKQTHLLLVLIIVGTLIRAARRGTWHFDTSARDLALMIATIVFVVLPWFGYNVGVTGRLDLPLGTSGWLDMPSAYSADYLTDKDRFATREEIFARYKQRTGRPLKNDVGRSDAGRKLFLEEAHSTAFWKRLPSLVAVKFNRSMEGSRVLWLFRFSAAVWILVRLLRRSLSALDAVVVWITVIPIAVVLLTFADRGRLIVVSWVGISVLAAFAIGDAWGLLSDKGFRTRRALKVRPFKS